MWSIPFKQFVYISKAIKINQFSTSLSIVQEKESAHGNCANVTSLISPYSMLLRLEFVYEQKEKK